MATSQDEVGVAGDMSATATRWKSRALIASYLVAMLMLYWPTTWALADLWLDTTKTTYTHGWIVLGVAFWLIMRDERLERLTRSTNLLALLAYVVCAVGWLVGYRAGMESAHEFAFPFLIWFGLASLFGMPFARLAAFPVFFLLFAIPIWDVLSPALQSVSATMVGHMLLLSGVNAFVDGNFVHIPAGLFEIAGGCSGIHFVMVGLALGALYGELDRDSLKTRVALCTTAFALAVVANWVRIFVIVLAGHLTNMQHYLVRVEHYRFGWVVFAVMMALFFWIARRFPSSPTPDHPESFNEIANTRVRVAGVIAGLLIIPCWNVLIPARAAAAPSIAELRPRALEQWRSPLSARTTSWKPVFVGADDESLTTYDEGDGNQIELYIAAYRHQSQGKELVGYHNRLFGDEEEVVAAHYAVSGARELVVEQAATRELLRFFYDIDGYKTASGMRAQLAYGLKTLWSAPLSRVIAVRTQCSPDCTLASERLDLFEGALRSGGQR